MRAICFYFQVHQPYRLRQYRFFDIGKNHNYFDDFANETILRKIADRCYLPANKMMLELIQKHGSRFRIAFSLSGTVMSQLQEYAPEVLDSFRELADTGCVEFLAETYSHSLSSLKSKTEFQRQVRNHVAMVEELFGQTPQVFRNTELIYSDEISDMVAEMGYKAQLTEGARHILGWRSPNFLYTSASSPQLKLLLKNFTLSDDIAFRFSNRGWKDWPLTTEKYVHWLKSLNKNEEIVNLFLDYETFGEHQWAETGIFDFMRKLPEQVLSNTDFAFLNPSEVADQFQPISPMHVQYPISWADEERDLTAWLGNEMQDEAFDRLYELEDKMKEVTDPKLQRDWDRLQGSDHFYYQCTKWFSDGDVHKYFNPYDSPYDAFINYMNILADFKLEIEKHLAGKSSDDPHAAEIAQLEARLQYLKSQVS